MARENEWTPGEWSYSLWADHMPRAGQPASIYVELAEYPGEEAEIACFIEYDEGIPPEQEHANARLLVASPALAAALEKIAEFEPVCDGALQPHLLATWLRECVDTARAALARVNQPETP